MKKLNKVLVILFSVFLLIVSCKKSKEEISDLDTLRNKKKKKSYPVNKMDSVQAIQYITKQKIQELLDLSTLYSNGNRDTEIDSIIYAQMNGYFASPDSSNLKPILQQLDSLKVKSAKVGNLAVQKKIIANDTIDFAEFSVEFFNKENKSLGIFNKTAQYRLKMSPVKFKKEFKFYFENLDAKMPKDSTSVVVTK